MIVAYHSLGYYSRNMSWPFHGPYVESFDTITKVLFIIAIPSFVFVSAYIFSYFSVNSDKYAKTSSFILKKTRRLLVPYFFWGAIQILLFPSFMSIRTLFYGNMQLWYLAMLFCEFLIAVLVRSIWKSSGLMVDFSILSFCILVVCVGRHYWPADMLPFNIKETVWYFPVFYVGIIAGKHPEAISFMSRRRVLSLSLCVVSALIVIFLSSSDFQRGGNIMEMVALLASSAVSVLSLALFSDIKIGEKTEAFLDTFSGLCMNIYIIHHIVIWIMLQNNGFHQFADIHIAGSVSILFFVSLLVSSLFAYGIDQLKSLYEKSRV